MTQRKNIQDIVTLTPMQKGMLYHYLKDPDSEIYTEQLSLEISGPLKKDVIEKAWIFVVQENEMLRAQYLWTNISKPLQIILKEYKPEIQYHDLTSLEIGKDQKVLEEIKSSEIKKGIDLSKVPYRITLCQIKSEKHILILTHHHILFDGWSTALILKEFFRTYRNISLGKFRKQPPLKGEFKDFLKWLEKQDKTSERKFWQTKLYGIESGSGIPVRMKNKKTGGKLSLSNYSFFINKEMHEEIKKVIKEAKITLAAFFYTCWGILLQTYNNSSDVIFGTTVSGRSAKVKDIENIVGLFINTVPFRFYNRYQETLLQLLKRQDEIIHEREPFEHTPLVNIKEYSGIKSMDEVFDTVLVIENYPLERGIADGTGKLPFTVKSFSIEEKTNYDLAAGIIIVDNIKINFIYNQEVFSKEKIEEWSSRLLHIVKQFLLGLEKPVVQLDNLFLEEKQNILIHFNSSEGQYPIHQSIPQLFHNKVIENPDKPALIFNENHLSFRELDRITGNHAKLITGKGINPGDLVGLLMDRSIEMIAGMLIILRAQCGYVPLNPKAPIARNKYILDQCNIGLLITNLKIDEFTPETLILNIKEEGHPNSIYEDKDTYTLKNNFNPNSQLAYVIFTSGSTGKPKGVPITHSNLSPLLHWGYRHLRLTPMQRTIQNLSYYFDWSAWEIFITLTSGACLYIVPDKVLLNPPELIEYIRTSGISILHITPTQFQGLANAAISSNQIINTLEYLCLGAEKLSNDLLQRSYQVIKPECRIFNMYGPTEASIMAAVLEIDRNKNHWYVQLSSIPIGKAIANSALLILDRNLNLSPINVSGELFIGGDGLAQGYLNKPEITFDKFIYINKEKLHPKNANVIIHKKERISSKNINKTRGTCFYQTGDIAQWLLDGTVEFLGRKDFQVKIRGQRIELGEIENQLATHPQIKDVIVIVKEKKDGDKIICAYFVPNKVSEATNNINESKLKEFLVKLIPNYMVPTHIIQIDKMPLNANRKIDMNALPEPQKNTVLLENEQPQNEVEEKLIKIWKNILNIKEVGTKDDFFSIGGHSLKVLDLINAIGKEFETKLEFQDIFENPTIAELSPIITNTQGTIYAPIRRQPLREYYPLSYNQKRMWFLYKLEPSSPAFNLSGSIILKGKIQDEKILTVLNKLADRHDSLRTFFKEINREPAQIILPKIQLQTKIVNLTHSDRETQKQLRSQIMTDERIKPFSLENPPLFRIVLINYGETGTEVLLTKHHIITDGWSIEVLKKEFLNLFENLEKARTISLKPLPIRYIDYVYWHNELIQNKKYIKDAKSFWENQLKDEFPEMQLPYDHPNQNLKDKKSSGNRYIISENLTNNLRKLAKMNKGSLFIVLLTGMNILLSRISTQEEVMLAIPAAARQHNQLDNVIGLFVNTLVLKNKINQEETYQNILIQVQKNTLQAMEYQSYPMELICSELKIKYPQISVFFNMLNIGDTNQEDLIDQQPNMIEEVQEAKFPLVFYLTEYKNSIEIITHFYNGLFNPVTIEKILKKYLKILTKMCEEMN